MRLSRLSHRGRTAGILFVCLGLSVALYLYIRAEGAALHALTFRAFGRDLTLAEGGLAWLLCLLPLLLFGVFRSFADLPWQQRVGSFLVRCAFFLAIVLSLSQPQEKEESKRVCTVALVDASTSVSDESLTLFLKKFETLRAARKEPDELRLVAFAGDAREVPLAVGEDESPRDITATELRQGLSVGATDVEGALRLASALERRDCVNRLQLSTDGIETRGDALDAVSAARARGVRIFTDLLQKAPQADAAVVAVELPSGVRTGEPFEVRVKLEATAAVTGDLRLYQGDMLNGLGGVRKVELKLGEHHESFESVVRVPGDVSYRAVFVPDSTDQFEQNNEFVSSVEVPGPPRVLLVDRKPEQATYLAQALASQQLDVDVRAPLAMPQSLAELGPFHFVILSDLARADVSRGAEMLLEQYVRGGGGLLYSGGEAAYGPGGWQGSRLEKILPVTMDSHKEKELPGVAMALVIDRSGSMTGLPLAMAKEACNATLGVLDGNDLLEVIAFDSEPQRFVNMQPARYRARIERSVSTILPGGGTEIFRSLDMAYQDLAATEARRKHIILLTDGNAGSDGIYELASTAFAEGITITTVGLGGGVNGSLLAMIAEAGGGRYHEADDPSRLPRIFTRETELISKKAAIDDWFPVSVVTGAEFLKGVGMGAAPLLRGYTSTQLGSAPSQLILASDRGEPILARRPVGLGYTLAWTSDLKARWATDWLKWATFGRFIAQLVREHQKSDDTEIRPMEVRVEGEELIATLEAYDAAENFDDALRSSLTVRHMKKEAKDVAAEEAVVLFQHVAPGLYQARVSLPEFGAYAVKAAHQHVMEDGRRVAAGVSFASVTRPYPEEFADLAPRPEVLQRYAELGGGKMNPEAVDVWAPQGDAVLTRVGRQNDFILLAVFLFLLDLLLRRVRLFDRDFRRSTAVDALSERTG